MLVDDDPGWKLLASDDRGFMSSKTSHDDVASNSSGEEGVSMEGDEVGVHAWEGKCGTWPGEHIHMEAQTHFFSSSRMDTHDCGRLMAACWVLPNHVKANVIEGRPCTSSPSSELQLIAAEISCDMAQVPPGFSDVYCSLACFFRLHILHKYCFPAATCTSTPLRDCRNVGYNRGYNFKY